jgi:type 1 glutamine amidotransferase
MTRTLLCLALALPTAAIVSVPRTGAAPDDDTKPVRALLVIGGCCHDYKKQQDLLMKGISARANVQWAVSYDPDTTTKHLNPIYEKEDWSKGFDVILHDECSSDVKDPKIVERILKPHKAGIPAVIVHCGMHCYRTEEYPKTTPWFEFTGLASTGHGPQAPIDVKYIDAQSAITKGLKGWTTINEELYNNSTGKLLETAEPLAKGKQTFKLKDGKERTDESVVAWTNMYNRKTRVFATTLGHNNETVGDAQYLDLVARGLLWSVDKLDEAHLKPSKKVMLADPEK